MRSLRDLQLRFAASLLEPGNTDATPYITNNGIEATTRLDFYRQNVIGDFRDALRSTYCVVDRLVGEPYFNRLAQAYFCACPSLSGDLNRYGAEFPDFLCQHPASRQLPYLPDVARLERAIEESFYAPHRPRLDSAIFATIAPESYERIGLELDPACRLLSSPYPIHRIWEVNQPGFGSEDHIDLGAGGVFLLVRRDRYEVALEPLRAGDYRMLLRLHQQAALSDALSDAVAVDPGFEPVAFLQRHIRAGTFSGIRLPEDESVKCA